MFIINTNKQKKEKGEQKSKENTNQGFYVFYSGSQRQSRNLLQRPTPIRLVVNKGIRDLASSHNYLRPH